VTSKIAKRAAKIATIRAAPWVEDLLDRRFARLPAMLSQDARVTPQQYQVNRMRA
jgi:hypothetical protein